jgi:DNA-binding transcriptional LysR family regulator
MDLRQLRYFVTVAEERHITRAAERLGIQQPPLSQQIRALERELDVQLFHRKPRGVELTAAGAALLVEARAVFNQIDRALTTTRRTARGEQGKISVGLTSAAIFHPLVPRVIREYRQTFPLVSVILEEGGPFELLAQVEKGQVDVAFIRMPVVDPKGVSVSRLLEEPMIVAVPSGHACIKKGREGNFTTFKDLSGESFIDYGRPRGSWPWLRQAIYAACHAAGFSPRISQETPEMVAAVNLVATGLGICIVPASLSRMNIEGVAYCSFKGSPQPKAPLNLAARRVEHAASVRNFISMVRRTAKRFQTAPVR